MAEFFKAAEIAATAVEMERRGQEFYKALARAADNEEVKRFFEYFATEESRHEGIFQGIADQLGPVELPAWSTNEEYMDYVQALLDSHALFSRPQGYDMAGQCKSLEEALRLAMSFEKDSLLFFMEMAELVPEKQREAVKRCAAEERLHLRQLGEMLKRTAA